MTREGWRVQGQDGMRPGMVLSMDLSLSSPIGVIAVPRAVVCWACGTEFGVKRKSMGPGPAAALDELFSRLSQTAGIAPKAA